MALINKTNLATGNVIQAQDILNIVQALDGTSTTTTIIASGSFTGSLVGTIVGTMTGTASFATSASIAATATSASYATTASYVANASSFPFTGSAVISGSLEVTGSSVNAIAANGPININGTNLFSADTRVNLTKNGNTVAVVGSLSGGSNDSVGALLLYNNGVGAGSSGLVQLSAAGASYISSSNSTFSIGATSVVSGYLFDVNGKSNFRDGISVTGSLIANNITGSLQGTSSYALTASYVANASSFPFTGSAVIRGSLTITGSFSIIDQDNTGRSIVTANRTLYASNDVESLNWENRQLLDNTGTTVSVNWINRYLYDSSGNYVTVDWGNNILTDYNGIQSIDWVNRSLLDSAGNLSIDWTNWTAYDDIGGTSVDWRNRNLQDSASLNSVSWNTRQLIKSDGATVSFDWENGSMTGSLSVTGSEARLYVDGFYVNQNGIDLLFIDNVNGVILQDATNSSSVEVTNRSLYDSSSNLSINWNNRQLYKSGGTTVAFDWENGILTSSLHGTASWANNAVTASYAQTIEPTLVQSMRLYKEVGASLSGSAYTASVDLTQGLFYPLNATSNTINIYFTASIVGHEYEFFVTNLTNDITFTAGSGITLISEDSYVKANKVGSAIVAKYITTSSVALIGSLKP